MHTLNLVYFSLTWLVLSKINLKMIDNGNVKELHCNFKDEEQLLDNTTNEIKMIFEGTQDNIFKKYIEQTA